jgi:hypothetical protein
MAPLVAGELGASVAAPLARLTLIRLRAREASVRFLDSSKPIFFSRDFYK